MWIRIPSGKLDPPGFRKELKCFSNPNSPQDLLYSLGVIVLYLAVIFLYSLAGGAALVALDAEATEAEGLRQLAEFEALGPGICLGLCWTLK